MDLEQLHDVNERIASCIACPLAAGRTRTVPGDGDPNAELMFIGEAPGFHEDRQGRPFVGQSGKILDDLLATIGLSRAHVFVANMVKCRPPSNRDPEIAEMAACEPFLSEQIAGIRPKLIVPLGRIALQYFVPGATISRTHGKSVRAGVHLIYPVYHPAAALRQGALLRVLREDFQRIPELLAGAPRPTVQETVQEEAPAQESASQLPLL